MYGACLPGVSIYGDKFFGISATEVSHNLSISSNRVLFRCRCAFSSYPAKPRIPELDVEVDLAYPDLQHIPRLGIGVYGNFDEFGTTVTGRLGLGSYASFIIPEILARGNIYVGLRADCDFVLTHPKSSWIAWSDIGNLDFTNNSSNVAGTMPLGLNGFVYAIEQLGSTNKIIVYGDNGIILLIPKDIYYGKYRISKIGIKGKSAIINTGDNHYFINSFGDLCRINLNGELSKLGYREFLSKMSDPVMNYNSMDSVIYISDGTLGYVYSEDSNSFGNGPVNITGVNWQDEILWIEASSTIVMPEFNILTDVYDMGTRKNKTINGLSITTNNPEGIYAGIQFRVTSQDDFTSTPVIRLNPNGDVKLPCFGVEFRFNILGTPVIDNFKIESIVINGRIHDYIYLDTGGI